MPEKRGFSNQQWVLDQDDEIWTLEENAVIFTDEETAILDQADNSTIRIRGSLTTRQSDTNTYGISLGSNAELRVGGDGWISNFAFGVSLGENNVVRNSGTIDGMIGGVVSDTNGGELHNSGTIQGGLVAAGMESGYSLTNSGLIRSFGGTGVYVGGTGNTIVNMEGGMISGGVSFLFGAGAMGLIDNRGTILSIGEGAIVANESAILKLINTGTITGDIVLGDLGNTIDTRGGTISGTIVGGDGDDVYKISDSDIVIDDNGISFGDRVVSSASFTLTGGLDDLKLIGRKNVNATGNAGDNELAGNIGRNRLIGGDGADILDGGKGRDVLGGGDGADIFIFDKQDGVDRITDLELTDRIQSDYIDTQRDFNRLDIRQSGQNLIIDFHHGDRLVLVDFDRDDFTFAMIELV